MLFTNGDTDSLDGSSNVYLKQSYVACAIRFRISQEHDTGEIAVLHEGVCPWKDHLFEIEEELGIKGEIKFVVYRDITNSFRVQAVPIKEGSFTSR